MARATAPVTVECYHCRHTFEVGGKTQSTTCASCNQRVIVQDVVVKQLTPVKSVHTCGKLLVKKKGSIIAEEVLAVYCNLCQLS